MSDDLYGPDGTPWCRFTVGTTDCINGRFCLSPNHVEHKDIWEMDYPKKDRYRRPIMPHPETGEEKPWTRVTTLADTLEEKYGLNERDQRFVAYGVAIRDDLRDLAMSADGPDDKGTLNGVIEQAKSAAAADGKANTGTALHGITQKIDRGDKRVRVPKAHQARIEQYVQATSAAGIEFIPRLIEVIVCNPELNYVGIMDRGVYWRRHGLKVSNYPVVYDLKSGSLDYIMLKTAQQEAAYANCTHMWDPKREEWEPLPEMNKDFGLVLHLPASGEDVEPTLHQVDLKTGFELLEESLKVREIRRSKGKHLFEKVAIDIESSKVEAEPAEASAKDRVAEVIERVRGVMNAGFKQELLDKWPRDMPTLAEGGLTDAQLDLVEKWCSEIERDHGL